MLLKAGSAGTYGFGVAAQDGESVLGSYQISTTFVEDLIVSVEKTEEGERDHELEVDGLRSVGFGSPEPRFELSKLCRNQDDDADGAFFCATPVTTDHDAVAELRYSVHEDVDVYTFTLARQLTVRIETRGETDTVGVLYDDRGHRLAFDDDGGESHNFRLVKTLGPGDYVLRVVGRDGDEGVYRLILTTLEW